MAGKPTLRVTKWMRTVPVVANCTHCGREFKVPMAALHSDVQARQDLTMQFAAPQMCDGGGVPPEES
ncbi:MAG TPA: hypothetical protein VLL05_15640 [Terriglobales bacterium]|nr:hypothetical protein [Terriglobales bacterium]